ncbi:MAG TPA: RNA polymerase sigma factor [Anaerolineae bacterium]|nr:RNA polymerase sigma factor [Anaerolineae bacterium]
MAEADLTELTDQALVDLCKKRGAKDDRPFEELVKRHQAAVWRVCYYFMGDALDAEDIVQDVFFKAHRGLPEFEGRASFRTWLNQITINTCKNELRMRSRRPAVVEEELGDVREPIEMAEGLDQRWQGMTGREELALALEMLQPDQFTALQLRDVESRSYAEVAQMLGISQSAAKMRVQRARLALRGALQRLRDGGGMP